MANNFSHRNHQAGDAERDLWPISQVWDLRLRKDFHNGLQTSAQTAWKNSHH